MTTAILDVSQLTPTLVELGVFPDILPYTTQAQLKVRDPLSRCSDPTDIGDV
jgi:hypothetical protein